MNPKYPEIVEREFRKAAGLSADAEVSVEFTDEEEIIVTVNGVKWTMPIGSDDDEFWFENEDEEMISFGFPEDWLKLEEDGPW